MKCTPVLSAIAAMGVISCETMTGPINSGRPPQRGLTSRFKALGSKPAKNQDPHRTVEVKKP